LANGKSLIGCKFEIMYCHSKINTNITSVSRQIATLNQASTCPLIMCKFVVMHDRA
jgi:hypothetical protein